MFIYVSPEVPLLKGSFYPALGMPRFDPAPSLVAVQLPFMCFRHQCSWNPSVVPVLYSGKGTPSSLCRQSYFPEISQFLSRTEFEVPSEITHAGDLRAQQGWSESDVTGLE